MESKWLKEALFSGMTSNAFKLSTILTSGWFWMRPEGCHVIYKGQDGNIDYNAIQAVMSVNAPQVTIYGQALPANTLWHYIRRQTSGCGLESGDSPACIVQIDADGDMLAIAPNQPSDLTIEKLSDGRFKLRWRYTSMSQEVTPTGFHVYMDSGSGFTFDEPDGTVSYGLGGLGEFSWTSSELSHGQLYRFCVRSYKTGSGESQNTRFVAAVADSLGPAAITGLQSSWEEI